MTHRAIALISGGLDSCLAVRLVQQQNIEVHGFHFISPVNDFSEFTPPPYLKVPCKTIDITDGLIKLIKKPAHGFGANMNPCIDCRIMQLKIAHKLMQELDAQCIVTGEVVGQRPMSQRKNAILMIEREAEVDGLVLRPLSALNLPETKIEKDGIIDRSKLLDISGRSRKIQIALAKELGVDSYPAPAGGCRLTDPGFGRRTRDMKNHNADFQSRDLRLLQYGRHFRTKQGHKIVVGRNHAENMALMEFTDMMKVMVASTDLPGPVTLSESDDPNVIAQATALTLFYCAKANKDSENSVDITIGNEKNILMGIPQDHESLGLHRIC